MAVLMVWSKCEEENPISADEVERDRNRPLPRHVVELDSRYKSEYNKIEQVAEGCYPAPSATDAPDRKASTTVGRVIEKEVHTIRDFFRQYLDDPTEEEITDLYRYLGRRTLYNGVD